mgnify:FL=1
MSVLQDVLANAENYKSLYESGQISGDEFKELIADLQVVGHINQTAAELETDEQVRAVLMGIVQLAGAL